MRQGPAAYVTGVLALSDMIVVAVGIHIVVMMVVTVVVVVDGLLVEVNVSVLTSLVVVKIESDVWRRDGRQERRQNGWRATRDDDSEAPHGGYYLSHPVVGPASVHTPFDPERIFRPREKPRPESGSTRRRERLRTERLRRFTVDQELHVHRVIGKIHQVRFVQCRMKFPGEELSFGGTDTERHDGAHVAQDGGLQRRDDLRAKARRVGFVFAEPEGTHLLDAHVIHRLAAELLVNQ